MFCRRAKIKQPRLSRGCEFNLAIVYGVPIGDAVVTGVIDALALAVALGLADVPGVAVADAPGVVLAEALGPALGEWCGLCLPFSQP
jgi:hypothetical protein